MAELLNAVDRGTEKYLLEELGKRIPSFQKKRRRMFVFEDIVTLDSLAIQRFLRDVDSKDLVIALKARTKRFKTLYTPTCQNARAKPYRRISSICAESGFMM